MGSEKPTPEQLECVRALSTELMTTTAEERAALRALLDAYEATQRPIEPALLPTDPDYERRLDTLLSSKSQGVRKVHEPYSRLLGRLGELVRRWRTQAAASKRGVARDAKKQCAAQLEEAVEASAPVSAEESATAPSGSLRAMADWALASVMSHDTAAKTARQLAAEVIRLEAEVEQLRAKAAAHDPSRILAMIAGEEDSPDGR